MVIFHSYVKLLEGKMLSKHMLKAMTGVPVFHAVGCRKVPFDAPDLMLGKKHASQSLSYGVDGPWLWMI